MENDRRMKCVKNARELGEEGPRHLLGPIAIPF